MPSVPKYHRTTVAAVNDQILEYCRRIDNGMMSDWHSGEYKRDYFQIFRNAYVNNLSGQRAKQRFEKARKRKKSVSANKFIVCGEFIGDVLSVKWPSASQKDHQLMVRDLKEWWDEWTYAWDHHPGHIPRPYLRKAPAP